MSLKYYTIEDAKVKEVAPECFELRLNEKQVDLVVRKLSRHFKFRMPEVIIWGEDHGFGVRALGSATFIRVPRNVRMSTVLHELGHCWDLQRKERDYLVGAYWKLHTKKLMRLVVRLAKYCRKKDYWRIGYDELLAPEALATPSVRTLLNPRGATLAVVTTNEPTVLGAPTPRPD